jgi:predicted DNA-binding protein
MNNYLTFSNQLLTVEFFEDFNIKTKKDKKLLIEELCNRINKKIVVKNRIRNWYCIMMLPSNMDASLNETSDIIEYQLREANFSLDLFPKLLNTIINVYPLKMDIIRIIKLWNELIKNNYVEACINYSRAALYIIKPVINDNIYYNEIFNLIKKTLELIKYNNSKISKLRFDRIVKGLLDINQVMSNNQDFINFISSLQDDFLFLSNPLSKGK